MSVVKLNGWEGYFYFFLKRNECRSVYVKYIGDEKVEDRVFLIKFFNILGLGKNWIKSVCFI